MRFTVVHGMKANNVISMNEFTLQKLLARMAFDMRFIWIMPKLQTDLM